MCERERERREKEKERECVSMKVHLAIGAVGGRVVVTHEANGLREVCVRERERERRAVERVCVNVYTLRCGRYIYI